MATSSYVGIDVSKARLDIAELGEKQPWQVDNTADGIAQLVKQMAEMQPELIVVEATGGYQRSVVDALFHAGLSVAVVNPARVRQFARACGLLAKTDKLDAQVLAVFGQRVQPKRYEGKSEAEKQLSALLVRRKQVEEMLKAEQNRLRTISPVLRGSVERIIAILKEEKKRLEEQICELMNEQQAWQEQVPHDPQRDDEGPATLPLTSLILAFYNLEHNNCLDKQDSCCTLCWAACVYRPILSFYLSMISMRSWGEFTT